MAIPVKNSLVKELLQFLDNQRQLATKDSAEANNLYHELLADLVKAEREEMLIDGVLPKTKGGAYII